MLIRALGPSLGDRGVPDYLADPMLDLHGENGSLIFTNDDWRTTQEAEIVATGVAPSNDAESAIVATLIPGKYTAVMSGHGATGIGLIEIYDLDTAGSSRLANTSTRALVATGDGAVIGGLILDANSGSADAIIRGLGPSLANAGASHALADPILELRDANGALLQLNDNWQDDPAQTALINASGIPPENDLESAIEMSLAPGAYTAILRGNHGTSGLGIIEIYNKQ